LKEPEYELRQRKKRIKELMQKIEIVIENKLNNIKARFFKLNDITRYTCVDVQIEKVTSKMLILKEKINANNPEKLLKNDYSRAEKAGVILNSVVQLKDGDTIKVFLKDGEFEAEVNKIKEY
jgi:exonuclease VII large subunit